MDETAYTNPIIQEIFHTIEEDGISPDEFFRMKDEYSNELLKQDKFNEGKLEGKQETALAMLKEGTDHAFIQKVTGLSEEALAQLAANSG